jgi:protoheme IX farnesyltransferase
MTRIESVKNRIKLLTKLNKIYITFAVGITTAAGYVLKSQDFDTNMLWTVLGIFILACSSSVVNHIQESNTDALMKRTKKRPIPSGQISRSTAWWIAAIEFIAGSLILFVFSGWLALLLGLTAYVWYNLIYTNLKKVTALAVIPGSVIGAIPPLVGWVAAGGSLLETNAVIIALFFFIWQIPHFWMLALQFAQDYRKAGLPALTDLFSTEQINRQIFVLIILTAFTASILAFSELITSQISEVMILALSIGLIIQFSRLLRQEGKMILKIHFRAINYYVLMVVILLCIDHMI